MTSNEEALAILGAQFRRDLRTAGFSTPWQSFYGSRRSTLLRVCAEEKQHRSYLRALQKRSSSVPDLSWADYFVSFRITNYGRKMRARFVSVCISTHKRL